MGDVDIREEYTKLAMSGDFQGDFQKLAHLFCSDMGFKGKTMSSLNANVFYCF